MVKLKQTLIFESLEKTYLPIIYGLKKILSYNEKNERSSINDCGPVKMDFSLDEEKYGYVAIDKLLYAL